MTKYYGQKHMLQKEGEIIFVKWLDAFSEDDWQTREDAKIKPVEIHSVGFVVEHTVNHLTLALSHDTFNDNLSSILTIPIGMIESIKKLK